jgi:isopentenyl-diphosphate delta-isomerase type 1
MKTEYFDIVNEKDEIIGKATRKECHSNPKLIHRGIFVIVVNKKGEILLSKRSMKKDTNPGKWEVMGGHNDLGESYVAAAKRELKEELGISSSLTRMKKMKISSKREAEFDEIFITKIENDAKIDFDKDEVYTVRFISLNRLVKEIKNKPRSFSSWALKVIKEYMKFEYCR